MTLTHRRQRLDQRLLPHSYQGRNGATGWVNDRGFDNEGKALVRPTLSRIPFACADLALTN